MILGLSLVSLFPNSYAEVGDFITSIDGTGTNDLGTLFSTPYAVAVDSNDRIIVSDLRSDLVNIYDDTGNFILSFDGTDGDGKDFATPTGIAVDSNDNILVADGLVTKVNIYDDTGNFITSIDGTDTNDLGTAFESPVGVAVDSNDRIIVSDSGLNLVQIYDDTGNFITSIDGSGTDGDGEEFTGLYAVAVDSNDNIIVSDLNLDLVLIYDDTGDFITSFNGNDGGTRFSFAYGVAVDSNDNIIVSDTDERVVQIFDDTGLFLNRINGVDANGIGESFVTIYGVAVDSNDRILVNDSGGDVKKVKIYEGYPFIFVPDTTTVFEVGDFITSFDGTDGDGERFSSPRRIAVDSNDNILVADARNGIVQIYDSNGSFISDFDGNIAIGIAFDSINRIITTTLNVFGVLIYDDTGNFITSFDGTDGDGILLDDASGVAVDSNDNIIVSDVTRGIIQIYDSNGSFITSFDGTGTNGAGDAFQSLDDIVVDSNDRIIVGDTGLNKVQIYDSNGSYIKGFWGGNGNGEEFLRVYAVTVDSYDNIIVGDTLLYLVQIYDSNGSFITSFDGTGTNGAGDALMEPYGIAVDSNDNILVVNNIDRKVDIFKGYSPDTTAPIIELVGDNPQQIFQNDPYNELGATCTDDLNGDIPVITTGLPVDTTSLGTHQVTYDCADIAGNDATTVERTIEVIVIESTTTSDTTFDVDLNDLLVEINNASADPKTVIITQYTLNPEDIALPVTFAGAFYDITSDESLTDVTLTIQYSDEDIDGFDESSLIIYRFTDGAWVALSTIIDTENNIATATTPGFSTFVLGGGNLVTDSEPVTKKSGKGGCADCVAPTLGLDTNYKRIVDNGFSYNANTVQVDKWYTPFPLINATVGETNTVEIIIYENNGARNIKLAQFGLGGEEIGQPLTTFEVLIEVPIFNNRTSGNIETDEITINDKDNLIENNSVNATSHLVKCAVDSSSLSCLKVILEYSYREPTINHIMVVNVRDTPRNSQNFYFNEGIQVVGESLNEPPTYELYNKKTNQKIDNLWLTLTRTDKVNHIWIDEFGIEYKQISKDRFDRITPHEKYQCKDKPLNEINVPTRNNCNFRALTELWSYASMK